MAKGKASPIELSPEARRELESLARRRSTSRALALRARIVLAAAEGGHNGLIAERLLFQLVNRSQILGPLQSSSRNLHGLMPTVRGRKPS